MTNDETQLVRSFGSAVWVLGMVAVMDRENWVIVLVSVETGGGVLITSLTSRRSSDPSPNNGQLHLRGASAAPPTAEQSPEAERLPVGCLRICRDPGFGALGALGAVGYGPHRIYKCLVRSCGKLSRDSFWAASCYAEHHRRPFVPS